MGVLSITIDDEVRITATSARIHASMHGSSKLFSGTAARKSAEVRGVVQALTTIGLDEGAVEVDGVQIASGSGPLRGQSVDYHLVVTAANAQLGEALTVLADRPGLVVERLEWVYDGFEASIPATAAAMVKARRKADAIAEAAGLVVTGVRQVSDSWRMPIHEVQLTAAPAALMARSASAPSVEFGVDLNSTTTLGIHLGVEFEVNEPAG